MNPIKDLPIAIRLLAISLILFGSFYLFFLSPKLKALERIKKDVENIEMKLQETEHLARNTRLPKAEEKRKWEATQARLDNIPAKINLPELMGNLAELARANHISDASFSNVRLTSSSKPGESKIQMGDFLMKISFHCHYRNLAYFLRAIDTVAVGAVVDLLELRKTFPLIYAELQVWPIRMEK